ncbi:hypothetical protein CEP54_016181 [Fusarium duplospermum]|uniref:Uncharacterized protein n=1 Tax=Fusarium duplospermum TaxID=1325734 RepID=A0A428NH69_9HYPO|nr:hypothetical protein CEP54_016181 [Fusarium duplospermum]
MSSPSQGNRSGGVAAFDGHAPNMLSILPRELRRIIYGQLAGEGSLVKLSSHERILSTPNSYHYAHRQGVQMVQEHIALLLFFKGETLQPEDVPTDQLLSLPHLYRDIAALSRASRQCHQEIRSYLSANLNLVIFSTAHELFNLRASEMATFALRVVQEVTLVVMVTKGNRQHPASESHWSHDCMCHYGVEEDDISSEVVDPEPIWIQARLPLPSNELADGIDFLGDESEIEPRYLAEAGGTWDGEECIREIQAHGANPSVISVLYTEAGRRGPPRERVEAYPKVDSEGMLPFNHTLLKMARAIRVAKETNPGWHSELKQFCVKVCVRDDDDYAAPGPRAYLQQIAELAGVPAIEERTMPIPDAPRG